MSKKSLTDEAVDGVAWQTLAVGANVVLRALILILLARAISAVEFGVIAAAMVVTNIAEKVSQIGVSRVLVQRLDLLQEEVRNAFAISLWTGFLAAAVVFACAPLFTMGFRIEGLNPFIEFLALTLIFQNLAAVPQALLQRDRRFRALGMIELGSYLFGYGVVALPMALLGFGAWSLAWAQMMQVSSRAVVMFWMRCPALRFWPNRRTLGNLLNSGTGFSAGQIGNFVAVQIDYFIVGRWLGAEALGFYNRAYQFLMLPTQLFGAAVSVVLFPSVAAIQDQPERVGRAYLRALGTIAMLAFPASAVLIIVAPELVRFVLGQQWSAMTVPFQILITTLLFRTSYKISDAVSLAMGSMYQRAWRQWIYAGAVAAGAFVGTHWGIAGVSAGVGGAVVLNFVLMLNLAREVTGLGIKPVVLAHLRQLAIAALIAVPVWFAVEQAREFGLPDVVVLATGCLAALVAVALVWFRFRFIFGPDAQWLHELLSARVGKAFGRKARLYAK